MSQHPSLRSKSKEAIHRSVLKRFERIKNLAEKEKWNEEDSIYGLPKQKIMKFKVKKEKSAAKVEAEAAAAGAPAQAAPAASAAKPDAKKEEKKK